MPHGFGNIVQIGHILVSEDVIAEYFACDYKACMGACCIEGDGGAPVTEEEIACLENGYSRFAPLMSKEGREAVSRQGIAYIDRDGDLLTSLVGERGACAFCHYRDDGSILCAIECAGLRKPASCSLYPIRVTSLRGGGQALNLHRWGICAAAFRKGEKEGIRVYRFLKEPLVRVYGEEFYEALHAAAQHLGYD